MFGDNFFDKKVENDGYVLQRVALTGKLENGHVGCSVNGTEFYARPMFSVPMVGVPSAMWLEKYHKHFVGLVGFEKNLRENSVFLGVLPTDTTSEYQANAIEDLYRLQSAKFKISLNDAGDELVVERLGGLSVTINEDFILVSGKDASQFAVLGNKLHDLLTELINALRAGKINTAIGPQKFMPDTQAKLLIIKNRLSEFLSTTVKLK